MSKSAEWPNIARLEGRLLGLGAPFCLPGGLEALDMSGARQPVGGRQARPVTPCVATSAQDREWLESQTQAGYRPVVIAEKVFLILSKDTDGV